MAKGKKVKRGLWKQVRLFLLMTPGTFTYGQIAQQLGTSARAIGACMRALGNRGYRQMCNRVTFA